MDEILGAIIAAVFELFAEVFLVILAEAFTVFLGRVFGEVFGDEEYSPVVAFFGYGLLGLLAGGVSVWLFPHPLVHPSRLHGISLLLSPLITGAVMSTIGFMLRRKGKEPARIESFTYGFVFALGMSLIRFFFVR